MRRLGAVSWSKAKARLGYVRLGYGTESYGGVMQRPCIAKKCDVMAI